MPNVGRVRLKETCAERGFDGRVLSATISRRADRWFVSLAVEREREIIPPKQIKTASDVVGVDLGLTAAAVIHDGTGTRVIEPQRALRKNLAKLRRLDRQLARSSGAHGTGRRRSCAGRNSTTGSPASGKTCSTSSRVSSREPSG